MMEKDSNPFVAAVRAFQEKFNIPMNAEPGPLPDAEYERFRIGFMREELEEYEIAIELGDLEKALDSLVDLVYVALGTSLTHGFNFEEAFARVQVANMTKQAGVASGRHGTLDVTKPAGWTPPDLKDLVSAKQHEMNSHGTVTGRIASNRTGET